MEITPYYGEYPLVPSNVVIQVNPEDRQRAKHLLAETSEVILVKDDETFATAKYAAGRLKAMMNEIEVSRKATKQPFDTVINAIAETAQDISGPVTREHQRILALLNRYVERLEAERKAQERAKQEETQRLQAELDRKLAQAREAQAQAEEKARLAQDEAERQRALAEARAQMLRAAQEQLSLEIAAEVADLGAEPKRGLVSGGRVDHKYTFRLTDLRETIRAGALHLLRFEIDHLACQDACREQLDKDPDKTPTLPGIEVSRQINVSVRARSR